MAELRDLVPSEFKDDLSEAEKLILKNAPKGEPADMRSGDEKADDPANVENWTKSRQVRAKFLEWLLRHKEAQKLIHDKGVRIRGVRLAEELDLECIQIPFPVVIGYSSLDNGINLYVARIQNLDLCGSYICGMRASHIALEGSLFLKNIITQGQIQFVMANIGGNLECIGAKFRNEKDNAFLGDAITTKGSVFLKGIECLGELRLLDADIGRNLECQGAKFINKNGISFHGDRIATKGDVFLDQIKSTGDFRLVAADIGGNLECNGAKFMNKKGNAFWGDGITTKGHIFLNQIESEGQFRLVSAHIGGDLYCDRASFKNKEETALRLRQATVEGRLCLNEIEKVEGKIDLSNTKTGAFRDDDKSWPDQGNLIINGFDYGSFADYTPTEIDTRLEWLKLQPQREYIPQPYQQLAKVYRKMGRDRDAKKVLLEKERMRREYGDIGELAKLWCWFLDFTIGYGYVIGRAVGFVAAIILLGTSIFYYSKECRILLETSAAASEIAKPYFNAFFYSIDMFVPFLDLQLEKYWMPDATTKLGWWVQLYRYFHIISGWVFSTLLVAGFTGLIRRE